MNIHHLIYLLLIQSSFVLSRSAFYFSNRSPTLRGSRSSVFYEPTSPPPQALPSLSKDTIVYSFSPLGEEELRKYGHRNTRDTDWPSDSEEERRLIERFNDPEVTNEPSCEELKKMWRLARKLQKKGSQANPSLFYHQSPSSTMNEGINKEESNSLLLTSPKKMKTDRRRLSVIPSSRPNEEEEEDSQIYGRVTQFQPNIKVHDPTNDIINILRSRKERQINHLKSLRMRAKQNEVPKYGNVRYAEPSRGSPSYLDKLRSALMEEKGIRPSANDKENEGFDGSLITSEPLGQTPRHFDLLRLQLLAKEKENEEQERMGAFETIKESLLNNRIQQRLMNDKARKGIRRKNARRRRKNLKQLMKIREAELRREYLWNLYEKFADNMEKKRRNRRNRKNGRHRNDKRTGKEENDLDDSNLMNALLD